MVLRAAAAEGERRALLDALVDVAEHPVALLGGDQRAHHHVGTLRVAVRCRPQILLQQLDALLVS